MADVSTSSNPNFPAGLTLVTLPPLLSETGPKAGSGRKSTHRYVKKGAIRGYRRRSGTASGPTKGREATSNGPSRAMTNRTRGDEDGSATGRGRRSRKARGVGERPAV